MLEHKTGKKVKIGLLQVNHIQSESREEKYARLLALAESCLRGACRKISCLCGSVGL